MSSLSNTIKMLFMLKEGKIIKKKEIAYNLEVSEKQVSRYKEALQDIFQIETINGPNGGYKLLDQYFPFKEVLTEEETTLLKIVVHNLNEGSEIEDKKLEKAIDKINYSIIKGDNTSYSQIIPYSKIRFTDDNFIKKQRDIYESMLTSKKIIINYKGNNGLETRREVDPYKIITYKGEGYLVAYCNLKNDIRFFKLIRISEYIITSRIFIKNIDIEKVLEEYKEKNMGIYFGEEINIILEISPPMANTIKERLWVDNQEIIEIENGKIIFKAIMKNSPEIKSWILSMQSYVKIIEPISLKEEIREILNKILVNLD